MDFYDEMAAYVYARLREPRWIYVVETDTFEELPPALREALAEQMTQRLALDDDEED